MYALTDIMIQNTIYNMQYTYEFYDCGVDCITFTELLFLSPSLCKGLLCLVWDHELIPTHSVPLLTPLTSSLEISVGRGSSLWVKAMSCVVKRKPSVTGP